MSTMLRKRSRPLQKDAVLLQKDAVFDSVVHKARSSLFFTVPGLFIGLNSRSMEISDSIKSPTSPLDLKLLKSPRSPKPSWDSPKVGLGLIDSLNDDEKNIVFGSQMLRCKTDAFSSTTSELKNTQYGTLPIVIGEIELSEDYTCIISHGPNPKTTHIFGEYIVEECMNDEKKNVEGGCCACKKRLREGEDVYMYRGEKAFCSCNCRNREILVDEEEKEKSIETYSIDEEMFIEGDEISLLD